MEALSEKGGFHDHDCNGRTVRWGWTGSLVQRPRPRSGDSRCGTDRWSGEHCRGDSIFLDAGDVCCGDLPSNWLSWWKCRALPSGAARRSAPRKPALDIDFASTVGMVTGHSRGNSRGAADCDLTSFRRLTVAQTRNELTVKLYDGEQRRRGGPIDVLLDYF